jgi:hypothetical protein
MSTIPLDFETTGPMIIGENMNNWFSVAGTSLYIGESSIMGAGDTALAFRGWAEIGLVSAGMTPMRTRSGSDDKDKSSQAWSADATSSDASLATNDWVELSMEGASPPNSPTLPVVLTSANCVFKDVTFDAGVTARYKMAQSEARTTGRAKRRMYAAKIHIQIRLNPSVFSGVSLDQISILAEMDGKFGVNTTTNVVKPSSDDADPKVEINYYMEKVIGETIWAGTGMMAMPLHTKRYEINSWVPRLIKVRFGVLATNQ